MATDYLNDEYHKTLADRYQQRKLSLSADQISQLAKDMGFVIEQAEIVKSTGGNVSGTFLSKNYAIKIQNNQQRHEFLANKMVSDALADTVPVVEVLAYDWFHKTDYELLIMRRGKGRLLLDDFYALTDNQQRALFGQILDIAKAVSELKCEDFGEIRLNHGFASFKECLLHEFGKHVEIILKEKLCEAHDINTVSGYVNKHINVFDDDVESFINHTDLHTGNALYVDGKISVLFDFDGCIKGPKYLSLPKIIGAIDEPSQFVEGTKYFERYRGKKFNNLYRALREKMSDVLSTPNLIRKLNLYGIIESMRWISENWSDEWNKNQIRKLLTEELAENERMLAKGYYGKIIEQILSAKELDD